MTAPLLAAQRDANAAATTADQRARQVGAEGARAILADLHAGDRARAREHVVATVATMSRLLRVPFDVEALWAATEPEEAHR